MDQDEQNTPREEPTPQKQSGNSYGGRPVWQWVLIYLVIGAILYGVIYLLFFSGSGGESIY